MSASLSIGELARMSGVPAKTIRYYEETGLIPAAERARNGYRVYGEPAVHMLRFVRRARDLGFSVQDVGSLLALWGDKARRSSDVKTLAAGHVEDIERKIRSLQVLRESLLDLVERCHGDEHPECPILDDLAGSGGIPSKQATGEEKDVGSVQGEWDDLRRLRGVGESRHRGAASRGSSSGGPAGRHGRSGRRRGR